MSSVTVKFLRDIVWFVAILVLHFGLAFPVAAQNSSKLPNIVVILADDMGYGDLG